MSFRTNGASPRAAYLPEIMGSLDRFYTPATVTAKRNTFTGSTLEAAPPQIRFTSAGAAAESGKLMELPLEWLLHPNDVRFMGVNQGVDIDFKQSFSCLHEGGLLLPAQRDNVDVDAWTGLELYSAEANTIPAWDSTTGTRGFTQLRRQVKDPTKYELVTRNGGGGSYPHARVAFTVPLAASIANPDVPEGASLALVADPFALQVEAWVNGIRRAFVPFPEPDIALSGGNVIVCGLVVWSGTQTGPVQIYSRWAGCRCTAFNVDQFGGGV